MNEPTTKQIHDWVIEHPDTFGKNSDLVVTLLDRLEAAELAVQMADAESNTVNDKWRKAVDELEAVTIQLKDSLKAQAETIAELEPSTTKGAEIMMEEWLKFLQDNYPEYYEDAAHSLKCYGESEYRRGWRDGVNEAVLRIESNLHNYHSPKPHVETVIREVVELAKGAADSVGDFQAAYAAKQDREALKEQGDG